jgi:hypothetical protein
MLFRDFLFKLDELLFDFRVDVSLLLERTTSQSNDVPVAQPLLIR